MKNESTPKSETSSTESSKSSCKGGNRRQRRQKSREKGAQLSSKGRNNDPNWYFTNAELANQASELSFQSMLGAEAVISNYTVPTIQTFAMNPSPGITYQLTEKCDTLPTDAAVQVAASTNLPATAVKDVRDGINLMSTKIYTLLSTYSGRTSNYGPQDIGIMILGIGELASMVEHIRRAFGVAMSYNPRNRMLPLGLLKAMNIDGYDLINHLADYRMRFNVAISRINQIPILDNIGYLKKCRDMYEHIYVDEVSSMAQYYLYIPASTWQLVETPVGSWNYGSWLDTVDIPQNATIADLLTILEDMIDALLFSSTLNIVYADLINLGNKISVPFTGFEYLAENYVVMPEYNRNANLQMHNMTIFQKPTYNSPQTGTAEKNPWHDNITKAQGAPQNNDMIFTSRNSVFADVRTNSVVYNPVFPVMFNEMNNAFADNAWYTGLNIVDMDIDNPTLEDRIEALRFKVIESGYWRSKFDSSTYTFAGFFKILPTLPDHYCVNSYIYTTINENPVSIPASVRDKAATPFGSGKLTQLKNHPLAYCKNNNSYCNNTVVEVYGDLTFYTTIDFNYLVRLNRLICTGLFDFR